MGLPNAVWVELAPTLSVGTVGAISRVRRVGLREGKRLAQGRTARRWQSWGVNQGVRSGNSATAPSGLPQAGERWSQGTSQEEWQERLGGKGGRSFSTEFQSPAVVPGAGVSPTL